MSYPKISGIVVIKDKNDRVSSRNILELFNIMLKSIADQTLQNYELIVVNYGGSERVLSTLQASNVNYQYLFIDTPDFMQTKGFNAGAKIAKSDILCFLDGDCIFPACLFENLYDWHQKQKNLVLSCRVGHQIRLGQKTTSKILAGVLNFRDRDKILEANGDWQPFRAGCGSYCSVRKEHFFCVGGMDEKLRRLWDNDIIRRLVAFGLKRTDKSMMVLHLYHEHSSFAVAESKKYIDQKLEKLKNEKTT